MSLLDRLLKKSLRGLFAKPRQSQLFFTDQKIRRGIFWLGTQNLNKNLTISILRKHAISTQKCRYIYTERSRSVHLPIKQPVVVQQPVKGHRSGFTLIELMVVITVSGALFFISLKILQGLLGKSVSGATEISWEGILYHARELSMQRGEILSLVIRGEKKTFVLTEFQPAQEGIAENEISEPKNPKAENPDPILPEKNLPFRIRSVRNAAGFTIPGETHTIHFYPDGSNDSVFIEIDREENRFLYIPPYRNKAIYLEEPSIERIKP